MPPPFQKLTLVEFADLLGRFPFRRQINAVHMHHTWRPRHADYRGASTIEGMWRYHTKVNGWSDIGQHISIAPDGAIWTGRGWNEPPASAGGFNGSRAAGPFMFEMIGDFDRQRDPFRSPQRDVVLEVIARVQARFNLPPESLRFHNQMSNKSCPGNSIDYAETVAAVRAVREGLGRDVAAGELASLSPFPELARDYREKTDALIELFTSEAARTNDSAEAEPPEEKPSAGRDDTSPGYMAGASRPTRHAQPANGGAGRGGRRRALCVGINRYPTAPLHGCVADAQTWGAALEGLGYEVSFLFDQDATRQAILDGLSALVRESAAGDVVIFQYAGHGTTLPDLSGDETEGNNRDDEALCPYDFAAGAFLVDDDVAAIFADIRDGVNLTCFFDCCHSGTITRFAIGTAAGAGGADRRPRFIVPTPELVEAHARFRRERGWGRAAGRRSLGSGPDSMRQVVFSACLDSEVAWETAGHGDFTQRAAPLLQLVNEGVTNEEFSKRVAAAFGEMPRQHPELDCAPRAKSSSFLSPLQAAASWPKEAGGSGGDSLAAPLPAAPPHASNGAAAGTYVSVPELLRLLASALESGAS